MGNALRGWDEEDYSVINRKLKEYGDKLNKQVWRRRDEKVSTPFSTNDDESVVLIFFF